jgi:hypothetical protein
VADWLAGVDLLDPGAVAAAARPVMAAMTNPNGLDRAESCWLDWLVEVVPQCGTDRMSDPAWSHLKSSTTNALEAVGLDLMDGRDWRKSAGVE